MTLGQFMIFRGQIAYGKVRPDPDESFGVIFSALALLGGPQCAVLAYYPIALQWSDWAERA